MQDLIAMEWDVFISHASEDKDSFVRPLAMALQQAQLKVWYDEFTLNPGDSLRRSIDKGLAGSRCGLVVLSRHFFAKEWPQKELDGLFALHRLIVPIWHRITGEDVKAYSPMLADLVASQGANGIRSVVADVLAVLNKRGGIPSERARHLLNARAIVLPTIESVLRKATSSKAAFFKDEPEWSDFEHGFIVERAEASSLTRGLSRHRIQIVFGRPAAGKSMLLKSVGYRLAATSGKSGKVIFLNLKKLSATRVDDYFCYLLEDSKDWECVIIDDAHLRPAECEEFARNFHERNRGYLIIGLRGQKPKTPEEHFAYDWVAHEAKIEITSTQIVRPIIGHFLARERGLSEGAARQVAHLFEPYSHDLWYLSLALRSYLPGRESIDEHRLLRVVRDRLRAIPSGEGGRQIDAEDALLPLAAMYKSELDVERVFLEEQLGVPSALIDELIERLEIIQKEEIGSPRMLGLIHSSLATIQMAAYELYPDLGRKTKRALRSLTSELVGENTPLDEMVMIGYYIAGHRWDQLVEVLRTWSQDLWEGLPNGLLFGEPPWNALFRLLQALDGVWPSIFKPEDRSLLAAVLRELFEASFFEAPVHTRAWTGEHWFRVEEQSRRLHDRVLQLMKNRQIIPEPFLKNEVAFYGLPGVFQNRHLLDASDFDDICRYLDYFGYPAPVAQHLTRGREEDFHRALYYGFQGYRFAKRR